MPALSFSPQFVSPVEAGTKPHTIRADRRHPIKPGDALALYTGMRTKACRLLFRTTCTRVQRVEIPACGSLIVDGRTYADDERQELALRDGFDTEDLFWRFFWDRMPFTGSLIWWDPADAPARHRR